MRTISRHGATAVRACLVRGFLTGFASHRIPQGMTGLPVRESETLLEELAEAYINMDLTTLSQFQRKATAQMTGVSDPAATLKPWEACLLSAMGGGGVAAGSVTAAPAAVTSTSQATDAAPATPSAKKAVEKSTFDISLMKYPAENKIKLIKELRSVCSMPIPEAKASIEKCPGVIATSVAKDDAQKLQKLLQALGAEVELT